MMMSTLTRKQREIADRDHLIKDTARRMLVEDGYLSLTMDRIAEAIEYSKGTVYQHYGSKEDLVGALAAETMERRAAMFRRAVAFEGRPRERIMAVGVADELFFRLNPDHFRAEQVIHVHSIAGKIAAQRLDQVQSSETSCMETILSVVHDAISAGDLVLREGMSDCLVLFGLRTMAIGAHTLDSVDEKIPPLANADFQAALFTNYHQLLDGYGWKPLFSEWDYDATRRRIEEQVFADEIRRLRDVR